LSKPVIKKPTDLRLAGHHHGEGELEQLVVGRAEELSSEKRREAALLQQGKLVEVIDVHLGA